MSGLEEELNELERTDPQVREAARSWESLRQRAADGSLDIAASIWGNPAQRESTNFQYRDIRLEIIWVTCVPNTREEALAYFTQLVEWGLKPVYLEMKDAGEKDYTLLLYEYNPETGELKDLSDETDTS